MSKRRIKRPDPGGLMSTARPALPTGDLRQYPGQYKGGFPTSSQPKQPGGIVFQKQFGPYDIKDINNFYELVRIPTPNVLYGELMVQVHDKLDDLLPGYDYNVAGGEVHLFGWNSGVKHTLVAQQLRRATGPMRWTWEQGRQFDSLSIEAIGIFGGAEADIVFFNLEGLIVEMTAVWRYRTSRPLPHDLATNIGG